MHILKLTRLAVMSFLLLAPWVPANAQDYPNKEIRVVCGFPAGSGADVFVRFFVEHLRPFAGGQPMIVDNKPGALSVIAAEHVARSKPDGYTIFLTGATPITSSVHLFKQLKYDPIKDFEPISTLLWQPVILTVSSKSDMKNVQDLIALLKVKGDKASYGGPSTSSVANSEIFKSLLGLNTVQVPYKTSSQAINDMYDGSLDFIFNDTVAAMEGVQSGRLRALAVTTPQRVSSLPDLPTLHESGLPGYDWTSWWAVLAPAGTPPGVVNKINGWVSEMIAKPEVKKFLNQFGADPMPGTPASTRERQVKEIERWKEIVKIAKFEPQ